MRVDDRLRLRGTPPAARREEHRDPSALEADAPAASLQGQPELYRRDQRATLQSRALSAGRALGEGWRCGVYCGGGERLLEKVSKNRA